MKFSAAATVLLSLLPSTLAVKSYLLNDDVVDSSVCSGTKPSLSLSGYFKVTGSEDDTKGDKNYYYWMHEAQEAQTQDEDTPFIIWLTGGRKYLFGGEEARRKHTALEPELSKLL